MDQEGRLHLISGAPLGLAAMLDGLPIPGGYQLLSHRSYMATRYTHDQMSDWYDEEVEIG